MPLLYDFLITWDQQGGLKLVFASEIEPNSDATSWTIRVHDGVEFHNGKTLTADDVIFTLQR
jgi:peptide/nickel transport system substrate-binding protein